MSIFYFFSAYYKETLLNDIRKAREKYQGDELAKELARIKLRIDNTEVLTSDIVINLLLSYRDIQVCSKRLRKIILSWDFGSCLFPTLRCLLNSDSKLTVNSYIV